MMQAFNTEVALVWDSGEGRNFDVPISSAQDTPTHHAFNLSLGDHC